MENENKPVENNHDYDFDILEVVKVGWANIDGVKTQFVAGIAVYVMVFFVLQFVLGFVFPQGTNENPNLLNQQIVGILSYPVLMPLMAGMMMMAIDYSRGEDIAFKTIFNYYHLTGKLALAGILIYIFTIIGFVLLMIPAIYVSVAYAFTIPLIVDKNMEVWEAMEHSRKTVTKHWFKVAGLMGLLTVVMFISALPFGLGLIWTVPLMFVTLYGLAYPIMFSNVEK